MIGHARGHTQVHGDEALSRRYFIFLAFIFTLGDVIAIDGKTLRRSHNHLEGVPAIHMVRAWSSKNGLVLGQEKTAEKSNEIAVIPQRTLVFTSRQLSQMQKKTVTAVRQHWDIENQLHWTLDMTFREDESRIRTEAAPENFAIIRHIALNLIKNDTSRKASVKRKRFRAALEDDFRENIIKQVI